MREPNTKDLIKLKGTDPVLQRIILRAISLSPVDFIIVQGLREDAEQWKLYEEGKATRTLNSLHLIGRAVDLGAMVQKRLSWDPVFYPVLAKAVAEAAAEAKQPVRWGGCWKELPWPCTVSDLRRMLDDYALWCKAKNKKPFLDLGHFEIPRDK
jgi:peptidoglycan L-alanyl-D-glutamate endopeptidase CwlK